jgi:hypothetical protein
MTNLDREINCELFIVLQKWLQQGQGMNPDKALEAARVFMREYWLEAEHQKAMLMTELAAWDPNGERLQ